MTTQLEWNKCQDKNWCPLLDVNLDHQHFENMEGVYVIWHGGENPTTVRVGQGVIQDRLSAHRNDNDVLAFQHLKLYVTWAYVSISQRDGVERYLAENLNPKVGSRFPQTNPIPVNIPW